MCAASTSAFAPCMHACQTRAQAETTAAHLGLTSWHATALTHRPSSTLSHCHCFVCSFFLSGWPTCQSCGRRGIWRCSAGTDRAGHLRGQSTGRTHSPTPCRPSGSSAGGRPKRSFRPRAVPSAPRSPSVSCRTVVIRRQASPGGACCAATIWAGATSRIASSTQIMALDSDGVLCLTAWTTSWPTRFDRLSCWTTSTTCLCTTLRLSERASWPHSLPTMPLCRHCDLVAMRSPRIPTHPIQRLLATHV